MPGNTCRRIRTKSFVFWPYSSSGR